MDPDRVKHLEFIQAVITRLASNSFLIKGWALTVAAALLAFTAKEANWGISFIPLAPIALFWLLDGFFIRQERAFRSLYEEARKGETSIELFSMDASRFVDRESLTGVLVSSSLALFYGGLCVAQLIVAAVILLSGRSGA
ncbi:MULTISPECIES: hypothetical protein [Streptomyces]|uniref:Uncharacterized protein n=1 Tax=Streptomyces violaceorubidus TaxID=284042 RepID=A0ABV1T4F2_9ACTN